MSILARGGGFVADFLGQRLEFPRLQFCKQFGVAGAQRQFVQRSGQGEVGVEMDHDLVAQDLFAPRDHFFPDAFVGN